MDSHLSYRLDGAVNFNSWKERIALLLEEREF